MLSILAIGACHPEGVISNQFLEDLGIGSSAEWIKDKLGVENRRTSLPINYILETKNSDPIKGVQLSNNAVVRLGVDASKDALNKANVKIEQIGLVIVNSCTPSAGYPSTAMSIAKELGVNALAYDVFTACPAFALHLHYLQQQNHKKLPGYVLCISSAALTPKVNYCDRSDSAIWGDGAAAWIVKCDDLEKNESGKSVDENHLPTNSTKQEKKRLIVEYTSYDADPGRCQAVVVDTFGYFHQDGRAVRDFSVRQTVRMLKQLESQFVLDWNRDVFIGHQANRTMLEQICANRNIPADNHWHNVTQVGNQAGAGAPAVIAENWNRIQDGQRIVVAVVGAGLSWGAAVLKAQIY